jgi:hypothetical protein
VELESGIVSQNPAASPLPPPRPLFQTKLLGSNCGLHRSGEAVNGVSVLIDKTPDQVSPRLVPDPRSRLSEVAKIGRVLVRFDHFARFI